MVQQQLYSIIIEELGSNKLLLPTLPDIAIKVREVIDDPNATAAQVADIIVTDAALSACFLKIANSALYRGRVTIETVQAAVARFGLNVTRNIVIGLVTKQLFKPTSKRLEKRMRELWEHSTKVAALSQVIAKNLPGIKLDEALIGGLIHDIGTLPILIKMDEHPELVSDDHTLDEIIANLHTRIGKIILTSWNFPQSLIEVADEHEYLQRNSKNGPDLCDIVQVANLQSYIDTDKELSIHELSQVRAFEKCGVDMGISVAELDENSEEYQEALALFNMV